MQRFSRLLAVAASFGFAAAAVAQKTPIRITADLSEAPRRLFHADIDLPVKSGPVTLITPQWIPGNHGPTGEASSIVGVIFTANTADGQKLTWRRDDVNLYEFHLDIPAGVTNLHAHLDAIVTSRVSRQMACLEWERLMLYPAHIPVKDIAIQPSVTVPAGWGIGTALTPQAAPAPAQPIGGILESAHQPSAGSMTTVYAPTTVEQLEDSPVIAGHYFHEFPLAPEVTPKHFIDVVSDQPEDSNLRPELLAEISNLVREAGAAYASHHYNSLPLPPYLVRRRRRRRPGARPVLRQRQSAKKASPTKLTNCQRPTCSRTSSPIPGTASIAARTSSTSPTSPPRSKASCSGSTKA